MSMSTAASIPYDWIRDIKPELKELDAIPLTGTSPSFPWKQLASQLAQSFERASLTITPSNLMWRSKDQLYEGLGDSLTPLIFSIPSMTGTACWVMPEQEMMSLESALLTKDPHPITFQDRSLTESFYRFLTLEVLYNISKINFDKTITPVLSHQTTLPNENALCLDISIVIQQYTLWGRLIISPDLRRSWVEHFAQKSATSELAQQMTRTVEVLMHLEAGHTLLSAKELSHIALGDWIALDHCSFHPETFQGPLTLTIDSKKVFRGELTDGQIKIIDFSLYQEVEAPMAKDKDIEDEDEEDFDDLDHITDELDLDEDLDLDEETELTNHELEEEIPPAPTKETQKKPSPAAPAEHHQAAAPAGEQRLSSRDIYVSLVVEIGQVRLTMDKLLALEPGNLLDLNIHPEDGVNLIVNGKTIGKGELIRIGDSIGVRILELGCV